MARPVAVVACCVLIGAALVISADAAIVIRAPTLESTSGAGPAVVEAAPPTHAEAAAVHPRGGGRRLDDT